MVAIQAKVIANKTVSQGRSRCRDRSSREAACTEDVFRDGAMNTLIPRLVAVEWLSLGGKKSGGKKSGETKRSARHGQVLPMQTAIQIHREPETRSAGSPLVSPLESVSAHGQNREKSAEPRGSVGLKSMAAGGQTVRRTIDSGALACPEWWSRVNACCGEKSTRDLLDQRRRTLAVARDVCRICRLRRRPCRRSQVKSTWKKGPFSCPAGDAA